MEGSNNYAKALLAKGQVMPLERLQSWPAVNTRQALGKYVHALKSISGTKEVCTQKTSI